MVVKCSIYSISCGDQEMRKLSHTLIRVARALGDAHLSLHGLNSVIVMANINDQGPSRLEILFKCDSHSVYDTFFCVPFGIQVWAINK
jgi:hypothetical protein